MFATCTFYLLFAVLTLVTAEDTPELVTCQQCNSSSPCDATCNVTKNVGSCFLAVEENSLGGKNETFFSKGCSTSPGISLFFSVTLGKGYFLKSNLTYCNEDKCNYGEPSISTNLTPNGLACPSCFNSTDNSCTVETVPCTGIEKYCTSAYGVRQKTDTQEASLFVAQGCATESVKDAPQPLDILLPKETYGVLKINTYKAPPVSLTTTAPTTTPNGTPSLQSISFVLLLTGLSWMLLVNVVS
ncbi:phospholipase A2 inhibitor and Ly6/PLAUR domain-containing protein-like [Anolis sagrei]|uniref:phospholipase A2 inhibitor and Ly6/PLAUR domain-containing protein-like n=1 Tax=Anolis sagrei TaxID=38937 RepID=UPI0035229D79